MRLIACTILLCSITACRQETKYPYTLADFPAKLQPHLFCIVNAGLMGDESYKAMWMVDRLATDQQVVQLTRCELPILRSVALYISKSRAGIDHYNLLMNHLDDTARVSWYYQCFSYPNKYVSDYMLLRYQWKTQAAKDSTIQKIIQQHNYLECAYEALGKVKLTEATYPIVKAMSQSNAHAFIRSQAWYHLAAYRKSEDKILLVDLLNNGMNYIGSEGLSLMHDFPDTVYLPVLKKYSRHFFRSISGETFYKNEPAYYLQAVAGYKNEQSAEILRKFFYRKPIVPFAPYDTASYKENLYEIVVANDCAPYKDMVKIARAYLREREKGIGRVELDSYEADMPPYDKNRLIGWNY